eukprot:TRINITY_DN5077_c0_g1_i1.p1 TRINITY_DN5077_c0_g1~~TRINITY_DN5077_c0_g1_i1.p1  ORF type:complete len:525 (-),score=123.18 TRINITY_DN5077_c0_g1_i1:60-1634(-)
MFSSGSTSINNQLRESKNSQTTQEYYHVLVFEARNVRPTRIIKRANPYCKVTCGSQTFQTPVVIAHLHPVWDGPAFTFKKTPHAHTIDFEVLSQIVGTSSSKFLGVNSIPLKSVPQNSFVDRWLPLLAEKPSKDLSASLAGSKLIQHHLTEPLADAESTEYGWIHVRVYHNNRPAEAMDSHQNATYSFIDEVLPNIKSGDAILFSGSEWMSNSIKTIMHSPYSHAGIVVFMRDPKLKSTTSDFNSLPKIPFLIEADWDDNDYLTSTPVYGVIVNPLHSRLFSYDGTHIWHAPLKRPLTESQCDELATYIMNLKDTGVKYDLASGLALLGGIRHRERKGKMFCSQLVALCYKQLGLEGMESIIAENMGPREMAKLEVLQNGDRPAQLLRWRVKRGKERKVEQLEMRGEELRSRRKEWKAKMGKMATRESPLGLRKRMKEFKRGGEKVVDAGVEEGDDEEVSCLKEEVDVWKEALKVEKEEKEKLQEELVEMRDRMARMEEEMKVMRDKLEGNVSVGEPSNFLQRS